MQNMLAKLVLLLLATTLLLAGTTDARRIRMFYTTTESSAVVRMDGVKFLNATTNATDSTSVFVNVALRRRSRVTMDSITGPCDSAWLESDLAGVSSTDPNLDVHVFVDTSRPECKITCQDFHEWKADLVTNVQRRRCIAAYGIDTSDSWRWLTDWVDAVGSTFGGWFR